MRVLIIGNGGREHALCWKISKSPKIDEIFTAQGNPGTSAVPKNTNIDIPADDPKALVAFASSEGIDLTIVGPEKPLSLGIVDRFHERGLKIFGPSQKAAQLESSKSFAKEVMRSAGVPTAHYELFSDLNSVREHLGRLKFPAVLKEDGLAQGKGVLVAQDLNSALLFAEQSFKTENRKLLVEEFLEGEEVSFFVISDGNHFVSLTHAQDHKRLLDGDRGPNTGGMGAYSPAPIWSPELQNSVEKTIVAPTLNEMMKRNCPFQGVLFVGLMLTSKGPMVLEFNARFGDPETQVILPRIKTDLIDIVDRTIRNKLEGFKVETISQSALTVVLASEGYPQQPVTGVPIHGLNQINPEMLIFHSGTKKTNHEILTNGGRVLSVTALGEDLLSAKNLAYEIVDKIDFKGKQFRTDIGWKGLKVSGRN